MPRDSHVRRVRGVTHARAAQSVMNNCKFQTEAFSSDLNNQCVNSNSLIAYFSNLNFHFAVVVEAVSVHPTSE